MWEIIVYWHRLSNIEFAPSCTTITFRSEEESLRSQNGNIASSKQLDQSMMNRLVKSELIGKSPIIHLPPPSLTRKPNIEEKAESDTRHEYPHNIGQFI
jgi:hypothetical protein